MNYQVVKLSNGEDIICNVIRTIDGSITISSPLKMETYNRSTEKGVVESLGLSRWVQPYSDEQEFTIQRTTIVMMTPVSAGLQKYYEYVVDNMKTMRKDLSSPTEKELRVIEKEEKNIEDLEDELEEMEVYLRKIKEYNTLVISDESQSDYTHNITVLSIPKKISFTLTSLLLCDRLITILFTRKFYGKTKNCSLCR